MSSRSSSKPFTPRSIPGYHCVGWIKSAHGLHGEVYVQLNAHQADWLKSLNKLGLCSPAKGEFTTRDVEAARPHKEGLIVKLAGVDNRNQSEELRKQSVYVDESLLVSEPGETFYLKEILGFQVIDMNAQPIGTIVGFSSNGAQDLLRVLRGESEVLIPLVDAFLRAIDHDQRTVQMELPEGLFDL